MHELRPSPPSKHFRLNAVASAVIVSERNLVQTMEMPRQDCHPRVERVHVTRAHATLEPVLNNHSAKTFINPDAPTRLPVGKVVLQVYAMNARNFRRGHREACLEAPVMIA